MVEPTLSTSVPVELTPEEKVEKLIKEAEKSRGQIFHTPGKVTFDVNLARNMIHSVLVDEEYMSVGGHLDQGMIQKIQKGEYVDFTKLLPKDRVAVEEDNRLQAIYKGWSDLLANP